MIINHIPFDAVELSQNGREVVILDQTLLPNQEKFLHLTTAEQIFYAITLMKVRGAPAIGIAASFGLAMCINRFKTKNIKDLEKEFLRIKRYLCISRPTGFNLNTYLKRMESCLYKTIAASDGSSQKTVEIVKNALISEAREIKAEDVKKCQAISEYGLPLLKPGCGILTHCNAGHLAVSRYGTALGPVYLAQQMGYSPKVYADETRPQLQGARLTAYELVKAGVDTTLICDNMASIVMSQGKIDIVMVGCDRIALNGDVSNKVGTSSLAILAKYYGIPFYVLGPTDTIDFNCKTGEGIPIEERASYEITEMHYSKPMAPKEVNVYNPSFDVTPSELITGIVTEKGILQPDSLSDLLKK